jgi:hypothetical protein
VVKSLSILESALVVTDDVGVGVDPGEGSEIDERRLEPLDDVPPHVEEAGAGTSHPTEANGIDLFGASAGRSGAPSSPLHPYVTVK